MKLDSMDYATTMHEDSERAEEAALSNSLPCQCYRYFRNRRASGPGNPGIPWSAHLLIVFIMMFTMTKILLTSTRPLPVKPTPHWQGLQPGRQCLQIIHEFSLAGYAFFGVLSTAKASWPPPRLAVWMIGLFRDRSPVLPVSLSGDCSSCDQSTTFRMNNQQLFPLGQQSPHPTNV